MPQPGKASVSDAVVSMESTSLLVCVTTLQYVRRDVGVCSVLLFSLTKRETLKK